MIVLVVFHILYCVFFGPGLMRDDTIYEDTDVKEALRRLPENQYNDRMFRIKRAMDLSMKQQILPKDQWTKYEEVHKTKFKMLLKYCDVKSQYYVLHCLLTYWCFR